jgi:hypothetical protein
MQVFAPLAAWRENKTREKGSRKGAKIVKECTIFAASYLCKGYYWDTKLPFRVRQQRWSTIAHDPWSRNMKLSDVESNGRKMIMFVCRWHLHWLLDPLLCLILKNH